MIDKTDVSVIGVTAISIVNVIWGKPDDLFVLLFVLMCADVLLGILDGVYTKALSSKRMFRGCLRKLACWIVIAVAYRIDLVIDSTIEGGLVIFDMHIKIRTFFLAYYCLQEIISILENCSILNLPVPKFIKKILVVCNNTLTNEEDPSKILELLKKWLNKTDKKDDNKKEEEHTDTTEADSESVQEKEDSESE